MLYMSTTIEISTKEHGTQPDTDYEDQFMWDDNKQEPINDVLEDTDMELTNKAGEKWKAMEPTKKPNKASKQGVILNGKEENPTAIRDQIKERGENALDHEFRFKTAVKIEWKLPKACLQFNV
eukprot:3741792-Ditylum_brightwellii.AAC.1